MDTSEIDKTKITHNLSQHVGIKASNYQQAQSPLRETSNEAGWMAQIFTK